MKKYLKPIYLGILLLISLSAPISSLAENTPSHLKDIYNNIYSEVFNNSANTLNQLVATVTATDAFCFSSNDGSVEATPTGGTSPYTYLWSNGATTQNIFLLPAGTYTVVITDATGCTASASTTINEPEILLAELLLPTNVNCAGGNSGSIALTVTGGTEPYEFDWDNAPDVQNPTGLEAGVYTVFITDANGCTALQSTVLTAPPPLALSSNSIIVDCSNSVNGGIDLTVEGGTPPYNYLWNNGATAEDPVSLSSGTYDVVVTDNNGCTATISEEVIAPESILLSVSSVSDFNGFNLSCSDSEDGSATVLATGGTSPFSYNWTNGATEATANDLAAGIYSVVATDANGCTDEAEVILEAPAATFASAITQDVTCFGDTNGAIFIDNLEGEASPFLFSLDGGDFGQSGLFGNLPVGDYELIIQDANGCETIVPDLNVNGPSELKVNIIELGGEEDRRLGDSLQLAVQLNVDTADLVQFGWTAGQFWMDEGCDSCSVRWIYPMETTLYGYEIVDETGCIGRGEWLVNVKKDRAVYIPTAFSPNGDGVNDRFFINAGQEVDRINYFKIYNRWGAAVFELSDFLANDPDNGWDGRFKGDFINNAAFAYHAEVLFKDGRVELVRGEVTVMR